MAHPEGVKEGAAYMPGELVGLQCTTSAVVAIHLLILDSDAGDDLEGISSTLSQRGIESSVTSTHSHLTTETKIKIDVLRDYSGNTEPTAEDARDYLMDKKGMKSEVLGDVHIVDPMRQTTNGFFVVVGHAPIQKGRIMILLKTPFSIREIMRDRGLTHKEAQQLWERYLRAVSAMIGCHFDEACKDLAHRFYYSRHPAGAEYYARHIQGQPLDLNTIDPGPPGKPDPKPRTSRKAEPKRKVDPDVPPGNRSTESSGGHHSDLGSWAPKGFQLADFIEDQASDKIRGAASSVKGHVVECPFDDLHSNPGDSNDTACFVMNASDADNGFCVWKCHHAHCQGRPSREFVGKALDDGWFDRSVLADPTYRLADADPCLEALVLAKKLGRDSGIGDQNTLFDVLAQCPDGLTQVDVLKRLKQIAGIGVTDGRKILAERRDQLRKQAREQARQTQEKPHFHCGVDAFDDIVAGASDLLLKSNETKPRLFRNSTSLVRIGEDAATQTLHTEPISTATPRQELTDLATWSKGRGREESSTGCPHDVAEHLLNDPELSLPPLAAVVDAPFFDANGRLVLEPGYHAPSFTYYHPRRDLTIPPVSEQPTADEIDRAKTLLMAEVDGDFPFSDGSPNSRSSRAHALALKLEPSVRRMIPQTPIYLIQKPTPGTGATLHVNALPRLPLAARPRLRLK